MRPRFEDAINTAKDMVENNIILFAHESSKHFFQEFVLKIDRPEYTHIADSMASAQNDEDFLYYVKHNIMESGTHAIMQGFLHPNILGKV